MNAKIKTSEAPVLTVGHIDADAFQAELYPEARIVICYSPSLDSFLSNACPNATPAPATRNAASAGR